jgi:hypothetical protein
MATPDHIANCLNGLTTYAQCLLTVPPGDRRENSAPWFKAVRAALHEFLPTAVQKALQPFIDLHQYLLVSDLDFDKQQFLILITAADECLLQYHHLEGDVHSFHVTLEKAKGELTTLHSFPTTLRKAEGAPTAVLEYNPNSACDIDKYKELIGQGLTYLRIPSLYLGLPSDPAQTVWDKKETPGPRSV